VARGGGVELAPHLRVSTRLPPFRHAPFRCQEEGSFSLIRRHLTPPPSPPSKPSRVCAFSRVVAPQSPHQHLHHLHPRKRAYAARFQGRLLLFNTTISTLKTEPRMLVFEGSHSSPTPPPSPPSKTSIRGSFSRAVAPFQHNPHHPQKRAAYARFWGYIIFLMYMINIF